MSETPRTSGTYAGIGPNVESEQPEIIESLQHQNPHNTSLVGSMVGSYYVARILGEGGIGTVYLGEHPRVGSRVAIKVLHDAFIHSTDVVTRFVREARAANSIASPHIVRVSDFGKLDDGRDYSVMEYLEGEGLDRALENEGPFSIPRAIEVIRQIAEGMDAAHRTGIIHRDLKPENIFLEDKPDGTAFVRILDFGIAKLITLLPTDQHRTSAGTLLGTPLYCAPEQVHGTSVGLSADIYALGAVAYEMLTGRPVFEGSVVEVLYGKSMREASPLGRPDVPQALEALIMQMLARDPKRRPASMQEVIERLAPLADKQLVLMGTKGIARGALWPSESRTDPPVVVSEHVRPAGATHSSHRLPVLAAAAVVLCIVSIVAASRIIARGSQSNAAPTHQVHDSQSNNVEPTTGESTKLSPTTPITTVSVESLPPAASSPPIEPSATAIPSSASESPTPPTPRPPKIRAKATPPPTKPQPQTAVQSDHPKGTIIDPFN